MSDRLAIIGNQAFAMRNFRGPLISAAAAKGIEVIALAPDYSDDDRQAIRSLGATPLDFPLRRASVSPIYDMLTLRILRRQLIDLKPTTVLSFSAKPAIFGTLAAASAGVPRRYALIEGLGHAFIDATGLRSAFLRQTVSTLYRASLSYASGIFFLNDDDRSEFVQRRLVDSGKAVIVGAVGVDLHFWRPAPPVMEPMTFLFVGRLLKEKGILEFVEAARRIKQRYPNVRFVVLGEPDLNPSSVSSEQTSAWVNEGVIDWPGHVDVKPWMERASVFVLPSYREGVPRSTQEAMAMARPIITTDVPGCRETVRSGENGFLVRPRDPEALAWAMAAFVENPLIIAKMGTASRLLAEVRFDVNKATARTMRAMGFGTLERTAGRP